MWLVSVPEYITARAPTSRADAADARGRRQRPPGERHHAHAQASGCHAAPGALGGGEGHGNVEHQRDAFTDAEPEVQGQVEGIDVEAVRIVVATPDVQAEQARHDAAVAERREATGRSQAEVRVEHARLETVRVARDGVDGRLRHQPLEQRGGDFLGRQRGGELALQPVLEVRERLLPRRAVEAHVDAGGRHREAQGVAEGVEGEVAAETADIECRGHRLRGVVARIDREQGLGIDEVRDVPCPVRPERGRRAAPDRDRSGEEIPGVGGTGDAERREKRREERARVGEAGHLAQDRPAPGRRL
jgi:hypothetical protein